MDADAKDEIGWLTAFVDQLMPLLRPYETTVYLYLLRRSHLAGVDVVTVGMRTISRDCGVGTRSPSGGNLQHIREVLASLQAKGCIALGERTRAGTRIVVTAPTQVPAVRDRLLAAQRPDPLDHYLDPALRRQLFERDGWVCTYCGEPVTPETATLDHIRPRSEGGSNEPDNLATACLMCNSLKAGRTYEEAAPLLLAAIRDRRRSSN